MRAVSVSGAAVSRPAVSITAKVRSPSRPVPSRRSRVTPGRSSTKASRLPTSRLNRVDLPTFGRPTMATVKVMAGSAGSAPAGSRSSPLHAAARRQTQSAMQSAQRRRLRPLYATARLTATTWRRRVGPLHAAAAAASLLRPLRLLGLLRLRSAASGRLPLLRGRLPLAGRRLRLGLRFSLFARRRLILFGRDPIRLGRVSSGRSLRRTFAGGLPWRRADALGICDSVSILQRRRPIALDQIGRNALRHAWDAFGEHGLAIARQLFLGIEEVAREPVGRVQRIPNAGTAAKRQDQR